MKYNRFWVTLYMMIYLAAGYLVPFTTTAENKAQTQHGDLVESQNLKEAAFENCASLKEHEENEDKCLEENDPLANEEQEKEHSIPHDADRPMEEENTEQHKEETSLDEAKLQNNEGTISEENHIPDITGQREEEKEEKEENSFKQHSEEEQLNPSDEAQPNSGEAELIEGSAQQSLHEPENTQSQQRIAPQQGLLDSSLLSNVRLSAAYTVKNGNEHISLQLSGNALLNIKVLGSTYVIFQLPPEIAAVMDQSTLKASFSVPRLLLPPRTGEFSRDKIIVDGNQVYMNFTNLVSLNLLNLAPYKFTLDFDIDHLPPSDKEEYTFYGQTTNQLIDLRIIDINKIGIATIAAPDFPEGELGFYYIPETMAFETTELPTRAATIKRQEPDWTIEVIDTRREKGSWQVFAQAEPLTSIENPRHQLPNALVFVDEHQNKSVISNEAVAVYSGKSENDEITRVQWQENEGPLLHVLPAEAVPGEYQTTITWTLVDAP